MCEWRWSSCSHWRHKARRCPKVSNAKICHVIRRSQIHTVTNITVGSLRSPRRGFFLTVLLLFAGIWKVMLRLSEWTMTDVGEASKWWNDEMMKWWNGMMLSKQCDLSCRHVVHSWGDGKPCGEEARLWQAIMPLQDVACRQTWKKNLDEIYIWLEKEKERRTAELTKSLRKDKADAWRDECARDWKVPSSKWNFKVCHAWCFPISYVYD